MLNKEFLTRRIFAVRKRLDEIPTGLSDLFRDILRRDQADMDEFLLCLQWILFAQRPLYLGEFYFAMASGLDADIGHLAEWSREHVTIDDMMRYVHNSSKGLAGLSKSTKTYDYEGSATSYTVQFIHESVRDFLVRDGGLRELFQELDQNLSTTSHERLKECCQRYLQAVHFNYSEFTRVTYPTHQSSFELERKFPFFLYAILCLLPHSNEAASQISQDQFLVNAQHTTWFNFAAKQVSNHWYGSEILIWALMQKCESIAQRLIILADVNWNMTNLRGQNALSVAAEKGFEAVVRILLSLEKVAVNACDLSNRTALSHASEHGNRNIVAELLHYGADVHLRDETGMTALSWATCRNHRHVVQDLLIMGTTVCQQDTKGITPLMHAAWCKGKLIVQLLLKYKASVDEVDKMGRSALLFALLAHHDTYLGESISTGGRTHALQVVQMQLMLLKQQRKKRMLQAGYCVDRYDEFGARDEDVAEIIDIVQLLLAHKANPNIQAHNGKTPLIFASQSGWDPLVKLLLDAGTEVDVRDGNGQTAVSWAARNGRTTVVQQLLNQGANIKSADNSGKTALDWAVTEKHHQIIDLLTNTATTNYTPEAACK